MIPMIPGLTEQISSNLRVLSQEIHAWCEYNFGPTPIEVSTLGLAEEAGEVCRAVLKRKQNIRGTQEEWTAELKKEYGDVLVKVLEGCAIEGWDPIEVLQERWAEVRKRDFTQNSKGHGISGEES